MEKLKYKVIKSRKQYNEYCEILENLLNSSNPPIEEVELLTLLIETWDSENNTLKQKDPIQLLKFLMKEHDLKSTDLAEILGVSKGMISGILNYRKSLSKEIIRKLYVHFKVSQELFNRPYRLAGMAKAKNNYENETGSTWIVGEDGPDKE
jgi:HTH-type transcriptional regulator / antitoxin HigA